MLSTKLSVVQRSHILTFYLNKSLRMPETLRVQHTAYVQNRAHHTDRDCASGQKIPVPTSELSLPCPREHLASASSASATERTQAPPTPQRVITSPAQRSTTEGAPWPIPRNCPPSPPPWPLISQRHGLVRRPRPPQNILRRPKNVPSAHAHPHPSERGPMHTSVHLQVHACACNVHADRARAGARTPL